jgi:hypothetical protein
VRYGGFGYKNRAVAVNASVPRRSRTPPLNAIDLPPLAPDRAVQLVYVAVLEHVVWATWKHGRAFDGNWGCTAQ